MNLGDLTASYEMGFQLEDITTRAMSVHNAHKLHSIRYEVTNTRILFTRTVYSIFDYMRDVGGFVGALYPICYGLIVFFGYRGTYMYLMNDN